MEGMASINQNLRPTARLPDFCNMGVSLRILLLVDGMSYQYLVGATIDYQEGLEGSRFVISNPNATATCGCGTSFSE